MGRGRKILELDGEVEKENVGKGEGLGREKKRGGEVGKAIWEKF